MIFVADEDRVNQGRTTLMNGQASRRRHCYKSRPTKVNGHSLQRRHLSEYHNDKNAKASRELVSFQNGGFIPLKGDAFQFGPLG